MKKLTNYQLGPRGVNTKAGTVWIDPGQTVEIDEKSIIGDVPDLGKKPGAAASSDDEEVKALTAKVDDLTKQVETLTGERDALAKDKADLTKQVETLTKPGK
jgi:hypothetical protein